MALSTQELFEKVKSESSPEEAKRLETFRQQAVSRGVPTSTLFEQIPISPEERALGEQYRREGRQPVQPPSTFETALQYATAVPAAGIAARGAQLATKGVSTLRPYGARAAEVFIPKTGRELAKGTAGAAALGGASAEFRQSYFPEIRSKSQELYPNDPARQQRYQREMLDALGLGFDVTASGGVQALSRTLAPPLRRAMTPSIPEERISAAQAMRERGAPVTTSQIMRGPESRVREGVLSRQQEEANRIYNQSVGLDPANKRFGTKEFNEASKKIDSDYNTILQGKTVTLDDEFFNAFSNLYRDQVQLRASGLMFSETRPILETLRSISGLPRGIRSQIDDLARQPADTTDPNIVSRSVSLINNALPVVQQQIRQGNVTIGAPEYNRLRSMLGDAAYRTADKDRSRVLKRMQKTFDDAADRSMPDVAPQLYDVRRRFESLKTLEQAQKGVEPGMIPAQRVGRTIEQIYDEGTIYGIPNRLAQIGAVGTSLGLQSPTRGYQVEGLRDVVGGLRFPLDFLRARTAVTPARGPQERLREVGRATAVVGGQNVLNQAQGE
jgi:hypothetical protein